MPTPASSLQPSSLPKQFPSRKERIVFIPDPVVSMTYVPSSGAVYPYVASAELIPPALLQEGLVWKTGPLQNSPANVDPDVEIGTLLARLNSGQVVQARLFCVSQCCVWLKSKPAQKSPRLESEIVHSKCWSTCSVQQPGNAAAGAASRKAAAKAMRTPIDAAICETRACIAGRR
jgi:hypothetical protein